MRRGRREMENKEERNAPALFEGAEEIKGIEDAFAMLQEILSRMDEEGVTLEESFHCYEKGMKLIKYCNETIDTVEKKVQILSAEGETDEF
jgi:exodeoxyribonuclease VII small subunit